jgi:hypothetical protein
VLHRDLRDFLSAHLVREVGKDGAATLHARAMLHFEDLEAGAAPSITPSGRSRGPTRCILERHGDALVERGRSA